MRSINIILILITYLSVQSQSVTEYSIGETHILYSDILEEEREIHIYIPQGFWEFDETPSNCPVIYILDGESQFLNTVSAIDYLSAAPLGNDNMPQSIVVGITNPNRMKDLTPTKGIIGNDSLTLNMTGGGPQFLDFITDELELYLDSLYSISDHRTIIGHSMGGLIVFQALLDKRTHFNNYIAIDPYLVYDEESYLNQILDTLRNADLKKENLYIATANNNPTLYDTKNLESDTSEFMKFPKSSLRFSNLANTEDWQLNYTVKHYSDETHFSVPYIATYQAMKFIYSYYPFKEMMNYYHPSYKNKWDLVRKIELHYQEISAKLGYEVIPMESFIYSWAYGMEQFDRPDLARDMFKYNIKLYPNRPSVYKIMGNYLYNQGDQKKGVEYLRKSLKLKDDIEIQDKIKYYEIYNNNIRN